MSGEALGSKSTKWRCKLHKDGRNGHSAPMALRIFKVVGTIFYVALMILKGAADWIGRSTIPEDASELQRKLVPVLNAIAEQPGYLFYGVPTALFVVAAIAFYILWLTYGDEDPKISFEGLKAIPFPDGRGGFMLLPIKTRPGRNARCRVVMEITKPDGSYAYPQYVLVSEHRLLDKSRTVGRVEIDDVPKHFELFRYYRDRRLLKIRHESRNAMIPVGWYRMTISVAGTGPARIHTFYTQTDGNELRITDGSAKSVRVLGTESARQTDPGMSGAEEWERLTQSDEDIARELDDLRAEGVKLRNCLIPNIPDYDHKSAKAIFHAWKDKILALLESKPHHYSQIRTLNLYNAQFHDAEGKSAEQKRLESFYTEHLARLTAIIQDVGGPSAMSA